MCEYFILNKLSSEVHDSSSDQIICLSKHVYILPKNNLDYYIHHGLFEAKLIEWCKQFCSVDTIMLDIGAHTGTYAISLASHCKHVYAFEPQRMTYYALCGSVALSNCTNITCIPDGLGSLTQCGKQRLNIVSADGGGSSLHGHSATTEEITVKTLDNFDLRGIGFIKMDVENNEHEVLLGAVDTIKKSNFPHILFEQNQDNPELNTFLHGLGYKSIPVSGVSNMFLAVHSH